jgi:uncharacterized protein
LTHDKEKLDLLLESGYKISSSLDGPFDVHTKTRKISQKQYDCLINNIIYVKEKQNAIGVVCVISKSNISDPLLMLDFFEKLSVDVRYNQVDTPHKDYRVSHIDYFDFLINSSKIWLNNPDSNIILEPIAADFVSLYSEFVEKACNRMSDCKKSFLALGPNGNYYPCNRFVGFEKFALGSVSQTDITDVWNNMNLLPLNNNDNCSSCEWFELCGSGCPSVMAKSNISGLLDYCSGIKKYLGYLKDLSETMKKSVNG